MNRNDGRLVAGHHQALCVSEQAALRTPIAWQQRSNMNLQHLHQQQGAHSERYAMGELGSDSHQYNSISLAGVGAGEQYAMDERHGRAGSKSRSRSRSSGNVHRQSQSASHATDTTSTTSSEEQNFNSRSQYQINHGIRQTALDAKAVAVHCGLHSTSASTWDGEPCPIHHFGLQMQPMIIPMMPPPAYPQSNSVMLLPPMLRPRPLVQPADIPAPPEPLPVRLPAVTLPQKDIDTNNVKSKPIRCCKGHIIVLWIILSIILTGILLGITLRFIIP